MPIHAHTHLASDNAISVYVTNRRVQREHAAHTYVKQITRRDMYEGAEHRDEFVDLCHVENGGRALIARTWPRTHAYTQPPTRGSARYRVGG